MKQLRSLLLALTLAGTVLPSLTLAASQPKPAENKTASLSAKPKPYPLDVCIVTDNDLGSMGEETSMIYEGQVIKFCCKPCEAKFLKNPAKFLAKLPPAEPAKK